MGLGPRGEFLQDAHPPETWGTRFASEELDPQRMFEVQLDPTSGQACRIFKIGQRDFAQIFKSSDCGTEIPHATFDGMNFSIAELTNNDVDALRAPQSVKRKRLTSHGSSPMGMSKSANTVCIAAFRRAPRVCRHRRRGSQVGTVGGRWRKLGRIAESSF